jgi:RNA polymerase sigma factor (sigma-70 family)
MPLADDTVTSPAQLLAVRDWNDTHAWFSFQRKYAPLLLRCCKRLGLDAATSNEVCQRTWIEVMRRMRSFVYDPNHSFRGWLNVVCRNKAIEVLRQKKDDPVLPFDERDERFQTDELLPVDLDDSGTTRCRDEDPLLSRLLRATQEIQAKVKAKVQPQTWDAFWLIAVRSCTVEETVSALGISHASAYKAKERVARQLRAEGERHQGSFWPVVDDGELRYSG